MPPILRDEAPAGLSNPAARAVRIWQSKPSVGTMPPILRDEAPAGLSNPAARAVRIWQSKPSVGTMPPILRDEAPAGLSNPAARAVRIWQSKPSVGTMPPIPRDEASAGLLSRAVRVWQSEPSVRGKFDRFKNNSGAASAYSRSPGTQSEAPRSCIPNGSVKDHHDLSALPPTHLLHNADGLLGRVNRFVSGI